MRPASNTPTTVQSREAKRSVSPTPAPRNPSAMARPVTTSAVPGRNIRPSARRTWGRSSIPASVTPRIVTFDGLPVSRLGRLMRTTGSRDTSRVPRDPVAMSGRLSTMPACRRSMPLCTSVCAERRMTTTLSGWPVATSVARRPAASISTVANT